VTNNFKYEEYKETLFAIQGYTNLISHFKSQFLPHNKNWEEYAFKPYSKGVSDSLILFTAKNKGEWCDFNFDFIAGAFVVVTGEKSFRIELTGQSIAKFKKQTNRILKILNLPLIKGEDEFQGIEKEKFKKEGLKNFHYILMNAWLALTKLKSKFLEETSSVNFWPHHFDLSMLYFTGKILKGKDPADWSNSREQINFGFSFGDDEITSSYFYVTAYPFPETILKNTLPDGAYWHTENWLGALLINNGEFNHSTILKFYENIFELINKAVRLENK